MENQELIDEKYKEWTTNLDPLQNRINISNKIRDIPFAVLPDSPEDPIKMLRSNKGICASKHVLLAKMFRRLGIKTKFLIYTFRWSSVEQVTPELRDLAKEFSDLRYHLAVTSFINNKWVTIDITWDKPLEKLGFHVIDWDGFSDTKFAVEPLTKPEILDDYEPNNGKRSEESMKFYNKLNEWLEKARK